MGDSAVTDPVLDTIEKRMAQTRPFRPSSTLSMRGGTANSKQWTGRSGGGDVSGKDERGRGGGDATSKNERRQSSGLASVASPNSLQMLLDLESIEHPPSSPFPSRESSLVPNEEQQQQLALLQHKESELRKMQSRLESYQEEVLQLRYENFQLKADRALSPVPGEASLLGDCIYSPRVPPLVSLSSPLSPVKLSDSPRDSIKMTPRLAAAQQRAKLQRDKDKVHGFAASTGANLSDVLFVERGPLSPGNPFREPTPRFANIPAQRQLSQSRSPRMRSESVEEVPDMTKLFQRNHLILTSLSQSRALSPKGLI